MAQKKPGPPQQKSSVARAFGEQVHQQQTVVHQQHTVQTIFDPDVLKKYKELIPDAPERVLAVFEKNSATERYVMETALNAQREDNKRRDWMAFSIIALGFIVSAIFAYLGKEWLSGGTLTAILMYAIFGYLQKDKKPPDAPGTH